MGVSEIGGRRHVETVRLHPFDAAPVAVYAVPAAAAAGLRGGSPAAGRVAPRDAAQRRRQLDALRPDVARPAVLLAAAADAGRGADGLELAAPLRPAQGHGRR